MYSVHKYVGDGVTTQFAVNFTLGYLNKSHVSAHVQDELDGLGNPVYRTLTWISAGLVDVGAAPGVGKTVTIRRTTPRDVLLVDFSDGAIFSETAIDRANLQKIMIAQEMSDERVDILSGIDNLLALPYIASFEELLPTVNEKAGLSGLTGADPAARRSQIVHQAYDYTEARALTGLTAGDQVSIAHRTSAGDGGGGVFDYRAGNFTAQVSADTQSGIYLPLNSDPTGASGCLVRPVNYGIDVRKFGAGPLLSAADNSTAINAALASGVKNVHIYSGNYNFNQLTIALDDVTFVVHKGATLTASTYNQTAITVTGANVTIRGGGKIVSPATWDGTNVAWTYAVIRVAGENCDVDYVTLENVPKVGIGFKDVSGGSVTRCRILSNYPSASYTGVETGHFGLTIDPPPSATTKSANFRINGNYVSTSVQGLFVGNYGADAKGLGVNITGNVFEKCWNHGVYNSFGADGMVVSGNSFNRCQVPVAASGNYHVITSNSMVTADTGADVDVTGISLRDPIGCVVTNNTIVGDAYALQTNIDLRVSSGSEIRDNIIAHNVIEITGGSSVAISVGGGGSSVLTDNIISHNTIRSNGVPARGLISFLGSGGAENVGNIVDANTITIKGDTYGIELQEMVAASVTRNTIRLEYDAPSAKTLAGIYLFNTSLTSVSNNTILCRSNWGTNVSLRGVWEGTGCTLNRTDNNHFTASLVKLTAAIHLVMLSGSGTIINETGPDAPNVNAGVGSIWRRTNGGAGTTLYVKESGTGASGFVGK